MKRFLGILLLAVTLLSGITVLARDTGGSMNGGQIKVQLGGKHRHRHHHRRHWRKRH